MNSAVAKQKSVEIGAIAISDFGNHPLPVGEEGASIAGSRRRETGGKILVGPPIPILVARMVIKHEPYALGMQCAGHVADQICRCGQARTRRAAGGGGDWGGG